MSVLSHSAAISNGLWARFWNLTAISSSVISTPAEASMKSRNSRRDAVHEEGPQGFVLPVSGVGGLQESARQC